MNEYLNCINYWSKSISLNIKVNSFNQIWTKNSKKNGNNFLQKNILDNNNYHSYEGNSIIK